MNKLKTYKDSKVLPLYNYERIVETGDFFYMVRGYEEGDEIEANKDELESLFNEVVRDCMMDINERNADILQYGNLIKAKNEITLFVIAKEILSLQVQRALMGFPPNEEIIKATMKELVIQKSSDLGEQIKIIDRKIKKLTNDYEQAKSKIDKSDNNKEKTEKTSVSEQIVAVEMYLNLSIDTQKVTLYRFILMQKQAVKIAEQRAKLNNS